MSIITVLSVTTFILNYFVIIIYLILYLAMTDEVAEMGDITEL